MGVNTKIVPTEIANSAWQFVRQYLGMFALVSFVMFSASGIVGNLGNSVNVADYVNAIKDGDTQAIQAMANARNSSMGIIFQIVSVLLSCLIGVAYAKVVRVAVRDNEAPKFESIMASAELYLKGAVVSFLSGVIVIFGVLFCVVPGIYLAARIVFAQLYVIDDPSISIGDAIKKSWEDTKGHVGDLIILGVLNFFIQFAGFLCCCVGLFVTTGIGSTMQVMAYELLSGARSAATESAVAEPVKAHSSLDV